MLICNIKEEEDSQHKEDGNEREEADIQELKSTIIIVMSDPFRPPDEDKTPRNVCTDTVLPEHISTELLKQNCDV